MAIYGSDYTARVQWHEMLASIHLQEANHGKAGELHRESAKLRDKAQGHLKSRNILERLKAKPLVKQAEKITHLALHTASPVNAKSHVTHVIAAAQIAALRDKKNVDTAASQAFQKLLAIGNSNISAAVKNHPLAKNFGIV